MQERHTRGAGKGHMMAAKQRGREQRVEQGLERVRGEIGPLGTSACRCLAKT